MRCSPHTYHFSCQQVPPVQGSGPVPGPACIAPHRHTECWSHTDPRGSPVRPDLQASLRLKGQTVSFTALWTSRLQQHSFKLLHHKSRHRPYVNKCAQLRANKTLFTSKGYRRRKGNRGVQSGDISSSTPNTQE